MNGHDAAGVRGGRPAPPCPVSIQGQDVVVPRDVSAEPDPPFKDEKTSPCAHVPQLVPYSGYLGMCAEIVDIGFFRKALAFYARPRIMRGSVSAPVAQLDRVSGYEPEGRAFESLRARQSNMNVGTSFVGRAHFHFFLSNQQTAVPSPAIRARPRGGQCVAGTVALAGAPTFLWPSSGCQPSTASSTKKPAT